MSDSPNSAENRAAKRLPLLLAGWGVSALLLLAAIVVLLTTHAAGVGVILFVIGAIGTALVSIGLLRTRAQVRGSVGGPGGP